MRFFFLITFFFLCNSEKALSHSHEVDIPALKQTMQECKKLIQTTNLGEDWNQIYWPNHQPTIIKSPTKMLTGGKPVTILYCRTGWIPDSQSTDDEYTPFVFVEGKLNAIGWEAIGGPRTFGDRNAESQRRLDNAARAIAVCRLLGLPNC